MKTTRSAIIAASIGACLWGVGGVASNLLFTTTGATPSWIVSVRLLCAGLLMLLAARLTGHDLFNIWRDRNRAVRLVTFAIFGVFAAQMTYMQAIFYGNAAVATIMLALVPAIITVLTSIKGRSLPRPIDTIAVVLALLGVFLLVTNGRVDQLNVAPLAIVWGLAAAATGAAYTLLPRPLLMRDSPLVVVGWGLFIGSFAANAFLPAWHLPAHMTAAGWGEVAFIILGSTFFSYMLYVGSLKVLRPAMAGMIGNFEPLTATLLSVIFLGLQFHFLQMIGIVTVLGAVVMMSWQPRQKRRGIPRRPRS